MSMIISFISRNSIYFSNLPNILNGFLFYAYFITAFFIFLNFLPIFSILYILPFTNLPSLLSNLILFLLFIIIESWLLFYLAIFSSDLNLAGILWKFFFRYYLFLILTVTYLDQNHSSTLLTQKCLKFNFITLLLLL